MNIADVLFMYATLHPYLTALVVIVVVVAPFAFIGQTIAHRRDSEWREAARYWKMTAEQTEKVAEELRKLRDRQ